MNLRRVAVLVGKEFAQGSRGFMFIFAILVPLVLSLVISLVFGNFFSGKPRLGIADEGGSQMIPKATAVDTLIVREYGSSDDLRQAVEAGAIDAGIVLPPGFDDSLAGQEAAQLTAYIWGGSLLKDRAILGATLAFLLRDLSGFEVPVEVVTTTLGEGEGIPWQERLLPLIVLMAVVLGGTMVPATSLVEEKQKRTLRALVITPTSLGEVFVAKGVVGFTLSMIVALVTLALNEAFGPQPLLLVAVLALGTILATTFGLLLGVSLKDMETLFATVKASGLLLYAPAFLYLFPEIPEWIGRLFPTYYLLAPVIELSQRGAAWSDIALDVYILIGLIVVLVAIVVVAVRRMSQQEF
jgi:ABC-2 type transport system permease protein